MRLRLAVVGVGTAICLASTPAYATGASDRNDVTAKAVVPIALWEMNEGPGATVMNDSSGNNLDGTIIPSDQITTGFTFDGATGYHWLRRAPELFPPVPERVIQVDDDPLLDLTDASQPMTVEIRFRTKEKFGNITQKGQATTRGGQIKFQNPQGRPSCMFKGSVGRVSTRSPIFINDNFWHTLTCVRTSTRVTMSIDGVVVNWQNGTTGTINNDRPWVVGGKINCDQIETTCDYFSGDIDYIRVTKGS